MSSQKDKGDRKKGGGSESDEQIHSANSWESADLGDKQRNEKFLRLMGASKKEHHGKIVIGDQKPVQKRERKDDKQLAEQLEEQFEHSIEHRLVGGRRGHLGLGYHPESEKTAEEDKQEVEEDEGVEAKVEEESEEDTVPDEAEEETDDEDEQIPQNNTQKEGSGKRDSLDKPSEVGVKKMKFVKSD
ncbi:unnamed protein product [Candidula unifasciata]|uniref:Small acidic protein n=1 Tax=Candidula unifasciata TaxID=100452 RepID=A0A8S3ZJM3_9EUPU|nr:unnamed protein product [Candidula unifasciata]